MTIDFSTWTVCLVLILALWVSLYRRARHVEAQYNDLTERVASKFVTHRQWLAEFPEVAKSLEHLYADIAGKSLLEGAPIGPDHPNIEDFRECLRREAMRRRTAAKFAASPHNYTRWHEAHQHVIEWLERFGVKTSSKGFAELRALIFGAPDLPATLEVPRTTGRPSSDADMSIETSERDAR